MALITSNRLQRGFPPTLVLHGSADGIVPIGHSKAFIAKLAEIRAEVSPQPPGHSE